MHYFLKGSHKYVSSLIALLLQQPAFFLSRKDVIVITLKTASYTLLSTVHRVHFGTV